MAQQTAVEWLVNRWKKLQAKGEKMTWQQVIDITELAKEMEKEQIKNAYWNGTTDMENPDAMNEAEEFYNEYYGA